MNRENPVKYSLQLTTYTAIKNYAKLHGISFRQASFLTYSKLKRRRSRCGFNLKSPLQFYSSLNRFRSTKMKHSESFLSRVPQDFSDTTVSNGY